jgi:mersacidin/lichenicidin family type 2 lantibiotic
MAKKRQSRSPRRGATTTTLHPLGQLYQQWALDFVIEAVRAIAQDDARHPDKYRDVPDAVTTSLAEFRSKVGVDPEWPSFAERNATYDAQLGAWFADAAAAFRAAVETYVQKSSDATRAISTDVAAHAVDAFRVHLDARGESALQRRHATATTMFQSAARVFRSPEIARVFNERAAGDSWPLDGARDAAGANLVGAIARELFPSMIGRMTAYKFLLLQRVADHGARTLTRVLDNSPLDAVMEPAYAWCQAARELMPLSTIIKAWRRQSMRQAMTSIERSLLPPHPSGDVTMAGTELQPVIARIGGTGSFGGIGGFELGFSTHTVGDEVCCSTGDLSCVTDASCQSIYSHCETDGICPTSPGSGLSCNGPCPSGKHHC